jgi:3'-phosphoadenosine 5'-phosphosulfate sulfotransferase (PAPS reductase)/FAD synthetase
MKTQTRTLTTKTEPLQAPPWWDEPWPWDADPAGPPLTWWDHIAVCASGGKDSQSTLLWLSEQPDFDPVRTWIVHNDTGQEHSGSLDLVHGAMEAVGVPAEHLKVTQPYLGRGLLDVVLMRRRWPGMAPSTRPCSERLKRTPTDKLLRRMGDHARILLLTGIRAEESNTRRHMPAWSIRRGITSSSENPRKRRLGIHWRPILDWQTQEVFARIERHGQEPLWCYDAGAVRSQTGTLDGDEIEAAYSRASCAFCVYLRPKELELSFALYPAMACLATKVEVFIDHLWREDFALAEMWAKVYGPGGHRPGEGQRLLALTSEQLVEEAIGRPVGKMDPELLPSLLGAAAVKL